MRITRILVAIALTSATCFCGDFWNAKAPADWSAQEVEQMLTRSPWAKEAKTEFSPRGMRRGDGEMRPPEGVPPMAEGQGGPGLGPGADGPGGGGPMGPPEFHACVRWESALPVRDALKEKLPREYAGYYVIAVSGMPEMRGPRRQREGGPQVDPDRMRKRMMERMKESTFLSRRGKEPLRLERVETNSRDGASIFLFFFPRGDSPIALDDGDLTFATTFGPMEVKAVFPSKNMVYHGKLEL